MVVNSVKKYINQFYGISLIVTLLVIGSFFGMFNYMDSYLKDQAQSLLKIKSDFLAANITSHLKVKSQVVSDVVRYIESKEMSDNQELLIYLKDLLAENNSLESIYFGTWDNHMITGSGWKPPSDYDLTTRPWFTGAIKQKGVILSDIYTTASDLQTVITISKPAFDHNDDLLGVVSADLTAGRIVDIIVAAKEHDMYAFLIDSQQTIIAYSPNYEPKIFNLGEINPSLVPGYENPNNEILATSINDNPGYILFKQIEGTDLVLGTFISLEAFKGYQEHWTNILIVTLLAIIVIFTFMFILHRRLLMQPLISLDEDIKKVSLDKSIAYRLPHKEKDPFSLIRTSVNLLLGEAQRLFTDLNTNQDELEATNQELLAILEQLGYYEEQINYHDQLTGLFSRRYFEESLELLNGPKHLPLAIFMIDVNGLKLTNDAFGHSMGDQLLKKVANHLKIHCGEDGFVARIGGDEFVIIRPNITRKEAQKLIDEMYHTINNDQLEQIVISISIGLAVRMSMEESMKETFTRSENNMFQKKITEEQSMRNQTIQMIMQTLNQKNEREKLHSVKVSEISKEIGKAMGFNSQQLGEVETAGLLHDIGKISIRDEVLNKPGKLTDEEYAEIKKHPESSYEILKSVDAYSSLANAALSHHERYDGKGYPNGLKGENIPLFARIICVADAYEAMIADRSYRKGMPHEAALEEIRRNSGTQFDPVIADYFLSIFEA